AASYLRHTLDLTPTPSPYTTLFRSAPRVLDFEQAFGRKAPTILEIGFGMGETTEKIALARPEDNFLGVEVFNAGVGAMLKRIDRSEEHTSELQSRENLVCRLMLEKK